MTIDVHEEMAHRHRRDEREKRWGWGRKLKQLRESSNDGEGLTQPQAAQRSGVHVKTLSSFETGKRIESMKVVQLQKLCEAYGITLAQFFAEVP